MKLHDLAGYLEKLEKTPSRLEITSILTDLIKHSDNSEVDKVVYLSLGVLAPNYQGVILNLAEKMILKTISLAYKVDSDKVKSLYKEKGDLGNVAESLSDDSKSTKNLSVTEVYKKLLSIAEDSGEGSQERKIDAMATLLSEVDPLSARFLARIPVGKLRLGFSEKTVLDALSDKNKETKQEIEKAYNVRPDIGFIAKLVKEGKLHEVSPKFGVPVVPMLAARLNSPDEMIKKMGEVAVEPKFDGLRIFIHFQKPNLVKIFTRNMNLIPLETFPELKDVGKFIKADETILDTEAIGIDPKREQFLDFQKTIQRRRKHEVKKTAGEIPLQFQVFDVLLINGKSYIDTPYIKRRQELETIVTDGKLLRIDESTVTKDPEVIRELHKKYLKMGLEGVVVKKANAAYVSGRTGWNWVKMKEIEGKRGKLSDTIDCVIMGYTRGKGKRAGFGVGQFLAGVVDGDTYKTITKVGTGLTDEQFKELNKRLEKITTSKKPKEYLVHKDLSPDFWVEPKVVIELAADEITISPKHTAKLALRFPRLIKFRDDRKADQATTIQELHNLYKLQKTS